MATEGASHYRCTEMGLRCMLGDDPSWFMGTNMGLAIPQGRKLLKHRVVSGLGLVRAIEKQRGTLSAMGVRHNPGIFVRVSPRLDRCATWVLSARSDHA